MVCQCLPACAEVHTGLSKTLSGFGGITRGVIQAASMGGKRRAPIMRLEELHQVRHRTLCTPSLCISISCNLHTML